MSIDGGAPVTVDLYAKSATWKVPFVYALTPGTHTIEIRATGTKNASSTGSYVDVDAFDIK